MRMFNQHTFDVKVAITVQTICNREGYYDYPDEIQSMKNEKCHLDFVVAVWDALNIKIGEMKSKQAEKFNAIETWCLQTKIPASERKKYLDSLKVSWESVDDEPRMSEENSKKLSAMADDYLVVVRKVSYLEKYLKQIDDVIVSKPIMPYPQERELSEGGAKRNMR